MAFAVQLRGNWKQGRSDPDTQRSTGLAGLVSLAILGVENTDLKSAPTALCDEWRKWDTLIGRKPKKARSKSSERRNVSYTPLFS